jgi:hypothetical protein
MPIQPRSSTRVEYMSRKFSAQARLGVTSVRRNYHSDNELRDLNDTLSLQFRPVRFSDACQCKPDDRLGVRFRLPAIRHAHRDPGTAAHASIRNANERDADGGSEPPVAMP